MNDFFTNLFGTIARGSSNLDRVSGNISFLPIDNQEGVIITKGPAAEWLGLENRSMQKRAYEFCYPLSSVIDRLAEADTNGKIEITRATGKGAENLATNDYAVRMNALLANPNPLQTWEEFRGQQVMYKKAFGFCPVLPIMPVGFEHDPSEATALLNLPPWLFYVQPDFSGTFPKPLNYSCNVLNRPVTYQPEQIFLLKDGFLQDERENFLLPKSKMVGLDMAVSNLCAAMEADNVLLKKKGPLGVWSHDSAATKDSVAGYLPMTKAEKQEFQNDLSRYGLSWSQYQYVVSRQAMRWNPMSFDVKQLGTKETILQAEKAICQRYNYAHVLLESESATFANQNDAHKSLYQNNVIPGSVKDMNKYSLFFKAKENNCNITPNFDHLPILQEDAEMQGRARNYMNMGLQIEYLNDIITKNQWLYIVGLDTIGPEGDLLYSQSALAKQKNDQAAAMLQATANAGKQQNSQGDNVE